MRWGLFFILIGVGIGYFGGNLFLSVLKHPPAPVVVVTDSLADFVARESASLPADERGKLITVVETILTHHFDTPSEIREEFRYQRLRAGIDSPAFHSFSAKWTAEIGVRGEGREDSIDFMREVYQELLTGLQAGEYRSGVSYSLLLPPVFAAEGKITKQQFDQAKSMYGSNLALSRDKEFNDFIKFASLGKAANIQSLTKAQVLKHPEPKENDPVADAQERKYRAKK
jgi:hypothetical protein